MPETNELLLLNPRIKTMSNNQSGQYLLIIIPEFQRYGYE